MNHNKINNWLLLFLKLIFGFGNYKPVLYVLCWSWRGFCYCIIAYKGVDFILYFWALVVPVFAPFDPIGTILIKKSFCCLGLRLVPMKFSFIACLILFWLFSHALKSMLTGAVWPDSWLIFLIIWPFTTVKIEWLHKNIRVEKFAKYYLNEP